MRIAIAVLLIICAALPAHAQQPDDEFGGPPSKTFERAIKLYDKHDFLFASIELGKVLAGESGDDARNKQRVEFFMAKSLYQLKLYAASWARFDAIVAQGKAHPYFMPTAKWLAAIWRAVPSASLSNALFAYRDPTTFDDPILASVRDELLYLVGRELVSRDVPKVEAIAMLERIDPRAPLGPEAHIEIERLRLRPGERSAFEANLRTQKFPAYGRYLQSRAKLAGFDSVSIEVFDAVMLPTACREAGDLKPVARKVIGEAQAVAQKLLAFEDHAERYAMIAKLRKAAPTPGRDVVLTMLGDSELKRSFAWLDELDAELKLLQQMDRAWQTTQVAAEVLQELVIQQSIGQADAGKLAGDRIDKLDRELALLERAIDAMSPAFAMQLDVSPELCGKSVPMLVEASPTVKQPANGCAGCTTRGAGGSIYMLLAVMLAVGARRRLLARRF